MKTRSRGEEVALPLPCSVNAPRDEAVSGPEEAREIGSLLLGDRELRVVVRDVGLKAMKLNGIALEGTAHSGADGVDDTGLRVHYPPLFVAALLKCNSFQFEIIQ